MAMVKRAGPISNITGKQGGIIHREDQCGPHIQAFPRLVYKRTWKQDQIRKGFADLHHTFYKMLTRAERRTWYYYAVNHPVKNKKGESVYLGGWPMFLKYNQANWLKGIPPAYTPPPY